MPLAVPWLIEPAAVQSVLITDDVRRQSILLPYASLLWHTRGPRSTGILNHAHTYALSNQWLLLRRYDNHTYVRTYSRDMIVINAHTLSHTQQADGLNSAAI